MHVPVADRTRALVGLSAALAAGGVELTDIAVRRPTLDEVFLHLTGGALPGAPESAGVPTATTRVAQ